MIKKIIKFETDLENCLMKSNFENFGVLMLHIRLKNLKKNYMLSYDHLTKKILELFLITKPKNVIVPSFTYSFTNNQNFDVNCSKSEVGKFSEIFRLKYSNYRTNDPIFSFCHQKDFKKEYKNINFNGAFINNSIWEYFYKNNITIVNLGLDHLVISLIHYIEFICKVPYRSLVNITGKIKVNGNNKLINYKFYAREKNSIYGLDWNKIEADLIKNHIIKKGEKNSLNFKWIKTKDLSNFIEKNNR